MSDAEANQPDLSAPIWRFPWLALCLLVPAPSIGVACSMGWFPGPLGQAIYTLSKVWILVLPAIWHFMVNQRRIEVRRTTWRSMRWGIVTGILIFTGIAIIYAAAGSHFIDADVLRDQARLNGLTQLWKYLSLAFFLIIFNSLLEEYVWRWFVIDCLRAGKLPDRLAIILAALFFAAHHLVALKIQGSWAFALTCSFGVFVGGWVWGELRLRTGSIWPGYISHMITDVIVFIIGYIIIFSA